ncbi:glycosyltransferase family 10 domain-containing protein [Halanaeroarchaeum sulfurireducens]|uniref:Fucosyltransferase n=1 Tax=Halanaeroarchaeum sulfurireducens TaxID=1604004 RepID=A0A0F7PEI7_9EURY|nr:glycosyltransferase family 10 [Halanaeroarchaeum sulfurireducens]AKH98004.1 fucosyltransferase [Halanaeroarchaeum sulfurireducens]ALG82398.1 fucosyltransferase [Halanaeroarchaeum sulfurireducens]
MQVSVVPQYPLALGDDELFNADEYDPTRAYGTDRTGFAAVHERFAADGHNIHTMDVLSPTEADAVIFVDMDFDVLDRLLDLSPSRRPAFVYLMREPPSVRWYNSAAELPRFATVFDAVVTWNGRLADAHGFYEYNIPQYLEINKGDLPSFDDRTLLTNVSSRKYSKHPDELYSERERIARFYDEYHSEKFTLHGRYWNDPPRKEDIYHHMKLRPHTYRTYGGVVDDKIAVYGHHRFALAFENMTGIEGYLTEKLFDCLRARTVPVYWGANDVERYVPREAFVDYRKFGTPERLHAFLDSMDAEMHRAYLEAASAFLKSGTDPVGPSQYAETLYTATKEAQESEWSAPSASLREEIRARGLLKRLESRPKSLSKMECVAGLLGAVRKYPAMVRERPSAVLESLKCVL